MEIPRNFTYSSPITGRSAKAKAGKEVAEKKEESPAVPSPAEEEEEDDIAISEEVFHAPVIDLPVRGSSKEAEASEEFDELEPARKIPRLAPSPTVPKPRPSQETGEKASKKANLEHRQQGQPYQFKHLIRPETAIAAHTAASRARAESPASLESVDHTSMQFGKIHPHTTPDYRPNRLFRVLDGLHSHSRLRWLEFIERGGVRFVIGVILFLIIGGFIVWRYFDSLAAKESDGKAVKVVEMTVPERIERGKKAVQEFLAAQTIDARLPAVVEPDRAAPRMHQFYETMHGEDPKVTGWEVGEPVAGKQGAWLPFIFQDASGRKVTVAIAEEDTGCRVDWENFVAFGDVPWQEYCETRPAAPKTLRVRLRKSDTYSGSYTTDKYQAYEIENRSGPAKLSGYAERAGRTGQALAGVLKGDQWQSAQLYLQFENSTGNQVTILDIVRSRWQDEATSWTEP